MKKEIKKEIALMLIPVIGTWWVLSRLIPTYTKIDWWIVSDKAHFIQIALIFYQGFCWIGYKVFYMMYFFDYTFIEVFEK